MSISVSIVVPNYAEVQGINSVVDQFIINRDEFLRQNISISGVYDMNSFYSERPNRSLNEISNRTNIGIKASIKKADIYQTYIFQFLNFVIRILNRSIKAAKAVTNCKDDIILFQDIYSAYYFLKHKRCKSSCIYMTHMFEDELEQFLMSYKAIKDSKLEKRIRGIYQYVYSHADAVVTICSKATDVIKSRCPSAKIYTIYNGIKNLNLKHKMYNGYPLKIVTACSLNLRKGSDILLDVFKIMNSNDRLKLQFHIYGDGDYYNIIKQWIGSNNISHVHLYGNVSDPYQTYSEMDCFLMVSRNETLPMSILEAMRSGLPIITTNVGAVSEMITDGKEGVFVSYEPEEILSTLKKIAEAANAINSMGISAKATFSNKFTAEKWVDGFVALFQSISENV